MKAYIQLILGLFFRWVKFKDLSKFCFVGMSTIAFGNDQEIFFINYEKMEETIYLANNHERGDGIACLAGHPVFTLFAFAELKPTSRIFVLTYPEFGVISILKSKKFLSFFFDAEWMSLKLGLF